MNKHQAELAARRVVSTLLNARYGDLTPIAQFANQEIKVRHQLRLIIEANDNKLLKLEEKELP